MAVFLFPMLLPGQQAERWSFGARLDLPVLFAKKYRVDIQKSHYTTGGTNPWNLGASLGVQYHMKHFFLGLGYQQMHVETTMESTDKVVLDLRRFYANVTQYLFPFKLGYAYQISKNHKLTIVLNASLINPQRGYYDIEWNIPDTAITFKPAIKVDLVAGFDLTYHYVLNKHVSVEAAAIFRYVKQDEFQGTKYIYLPDFANIHGSYGGFGLGVVYQL